MKDILQMLEGNPVVAAVKDREDLSAALDSAVDTIFLLGGNICEIREIVDAVSGAGKTLFVHMDLIEGLGRDNYALKFLHDYARPDGIITTKPGLIRPAKELDLLVIQRVFMLDSMSLDVALKAFDRSGPTADAVEILPGLLFGIINMFAERTRKPVIAGGLIRSKEEAIGALKAGATGVSTSNVALWDM